MRLPITAAAVLLVFFWAGLASAANNPIPGVDILFPCKCHRSGMVTTDKAGTFAFENPHQGKHLFSLDLTKVKAVAGTGKATVRHTKSMVKGVEVYNIVVTFDKNAAKEFEPLEIQFGDKGGRITGAIYHEVPEKQDKK